MMDRRLALLLASVIGLAGYSLWSGDSALMAYLHPSGASSEDAGVTAQDRPGAKPAAVADLNPRAKLSATQFEDIVNRPLFNPSRAPKPPQPEPEPEPETVATEAPAEEAPPTNPDDFSLLGIAAKDGNWTAVLRWNPTNEVFRLQAGGEIQGWTVAEIALKQVTVNKDGETLAIKMFQQKYTPPAASAEGAEEGMRRADPNQDDVDQ